MNEPEGPWMPPPTPRWVLVVACFAMIADPIVAYLVFGGGQ